MTDFGKYKNLDVGGLIKYPFTGREQPTDFNKATEPGYYAASYDIKPLNPPVADEQWYGSMIVSSAVGGSGGNPLMQMVILLYPRKAIVIRHRWAGAWGEWTIYN